MIEEEEWKKLCGVAKKEEEKRWEVQPLWIAFPSSMYWNLHQLNWNATDSERKLEKTSEDSVGHSLILELPGEIL